MLKNICCLLAIMILSAAPAFAGEDSGLPHGKWWNNNDVVSQLNLTDTEIKTLDESYVNHRRKLIKLRAQVEEEQFELNNLIDSRTLNDEAVLNQFKKLEQARSNLSREWFSFFLDARKLLGFDRYQQLKSMYQQMRNKRKSGRFGEKMDRRHFNNLEKFRPSSFRKDGRARKQGYKNDNDLMNGTDSSRQPSTDVSPFNDPADPSEEAL